jgi:hypothetical protein
MKRQLNRQILVHTKTSIATLLWLTMTNTGTALLHVGPNSKAQAKKMSIAFVVIDNTKLNEVQQSLLVLTLIQVSSVCFQ